ncbi:MAG TPA: biotin/lipoyl-binding protein [Candidatus Thalassarchaeaceae archaeon]|jgi:biotin carboxyl carrier protein|nr:MAG TPA: biotin/lipoyl-binding protein [Candidatus Poseidoniales archaeon]HII35393.1 biotin/lipoyl-binding protein [Candidatus Thalassarchaeaceae archaeon]|tara:strand:- start:1066 stop:1470 length:405 start_codon:yes stop_codon:yes gene_type:complete
MDGKRRVSVDGEEFEVSMGKEGDYWKVEVEGKIFSIKVEGDKEGASSPRKKRGARKTKRSGVVSSSIPGKVISISVVKEDLVSEGDVIMILEAMKMQNEIQAPISGKISELNCGPGDSIEANSPLLVIEPPSDE